MTTNKQNAILKGYKQTKLSVIPEEWANLRKEIDL
jgi:hypothetical protein